MNDYEVILQKAADQGLNVIEGCTFESDAKGLVAGRNIGLSSTLETTAEKRCVLSEEIAHTQLSVADITDPSESISRHEELKARRRSHDELIGISGLIDAYTARCTNRYEAAQYLNVTEEFLQAAIDGYIARYGPFLVKGDYIITLSPIGVIKRC